MSTEILAPGIVKFSSCFRISHSQIENLARLKDASFASAYDFVYDDNGNLLYALNKSHHKVPAEYINKIHVTIGEGLDRDLVEILEESIYKSLLQYLLIYPDAYRSIWWRTVGHVAAYPAGTYLSAHSDNDVNYRPNTTPKDQAAVQHVLSCSALLNDDFSGGDFFFEYYDLNVKAKAGDILMFPSNFLGAHGVAEITEGTRYSYVSWFGHGSPDESKNIQPQIGSGEFPLPGQVWMDQLFTDFPKLVRSTPNATTRLFNSPEDH